MSSSRTYDNSNDDRDLIDSSKDILRLCLFVYSEEEEREKQYKLTFSLQINLIDIENKFITKKHGIDSWQKEKRE